MKKRVLSMFMALALCLTLLPAPVRAAEDTPESGAIVQEEQQEAPAAESPAISEQAAENGITVQDGSGSQKATFSVTADNNVKEGRYKLKLTADSEAGYSPNKATATATVTVAAAPRNPITINKQTKVVYEKLDGESVAVVDVNASLASGLSGKITYQWYVDGNKFTGTGSDRYKITLTQSDLTPVEGRNWEYSGPVYCKLSYNDYTVNTDTVTVTINTCPHEKYTHEGKCQQCGEPCRAEATSWYYNSAEHSLQMNAQPTTTGNEITYEWYDGDKKLECTSDTYTVPKTMPAGSYTYTCKATCDGYTLSHDFTFTVEECKHEGVEITFNSNGFGNCPKCNATVYQPAVETTDKYDIDDDGEKETVYEISNAGQLYWFAGLVNGTLDGVEQNTLANAVLTANITVNENLLDSLQYDTEGNVSNGSDFITWTPIADWMGNRTTQYSGTFDGNNKTVSGLYFNGDSTCIGLFGSSESDGNIKNVGVVDSYFKGNDHVGGVCGNNAGTITNCYNAGNLTAIESSATIGGICGYNNGGTIANCYNTGTVTATGIVASVGGVCGCSTELILNCYNIGTVTAASSGADISGICGYNFGPIKNCYYLADTEDENGGKTAAQFASGEIAYLLSQGCTVGEGEDAVTYSGSVWGQALGGNGDTYPVLDSTKRVYQVDKYDGCEGKPGSSTKIYSNQSTSIYEEHKYEADTTDSTKHKCSICNGTEEHSFAYELVENGNAIKATCSECGATYTVKLTQPAATSDEKIVYDGTEKKAGTAIDSGNTGIETISENAITYAGVTNGTLSTYSTTAPKNAGTYKAKLTLGTGDNIVSIEINFTIEKAASPTIAGEEKSYIYSTGSDGKTIGVDIVGKLPTDRGITTYAVAKTDTEQLLSEVTVDTAGNLTYKVNQVDSTKVGKTAIITVTASMENYANAGYTLTISITDKKTVEIKRGNSVSVDGSNVLIYGEKISKLTLANTVFVEAGTDDVIEGILSWSNPDEIPAAGTTQAGWVFKPADSKHYEELTGTAAITVARATPAVVTVPAVAERVYNPAVALADSDMTGGSVTGADGNELAGTWSFTGTNIIPTVNNKGYQAVFTPDDANNYSTVTRTITVKVTKATLVIAEKPTAGALTYGQKLSDSTLTGGKAAYQTADGTEITGAFAWKNGSIKPTAADSQKTEYDVTFTPSDKDNYNAVDTKLALTVNKAAQAPNMPQAAMAPAQSTKKVGDITLPDGWSWQEADKDTALADGVAVTATAVYTGADKGNYETESVSITITRSKCDHTHTEIRNQREATCKKEGYTGDTYCKDCGEKLATGTATEKKPHTVGTPATCVSKAVCSVCSETFGEVDATNHVHTTVKNRKEATCTQTGYTGDTYCTDCDKLLETGKELAAWGHDYKATVTKQPTITEEGVRTYTCTRCNSSYTESIAKLTEEQHTHNYAGSVTKEATCTEAGVRTYTCSCGDSYTENIPATGHSYVSKVTKAATTTEEGIMTYTCSKCGHSYTQPIAMIKSDNSNKDNGKDNGTSIKPYIKDDSGKEGWDVIKPQLEEAKSGDTVTVAMNGTTVVPKDVIDSIKGKDTTLVLDMGNGLSWKIYGKDITDAAGDIDFDVKVGADAGKSIPVGVINNVTGERSSLNLTLAYDGEFGFTATLTVNMESKNAGLYANLFYYNEQTGELEFISAGQIDPDGNVELVFTHASDYTIVVDTRIMSDNGQADNKADENIPASKTDDSTSKYAWNNTIIIIIGICIMLIVIGAVFYVRKKSGSEEK